MPYRNKNALKNIQRQTAFRLFRAAETGFAGRFSPPRSLRMAEKQSVRGEAHHHPAKPGDLLQIAQLAFQLVF